MVTSLTNLIKQNEQKDTRSNLTLGNTFLNLHCNAIEWFSTIKHMEIGP